MQYLKIFDKLGRSFTSYDVILRQINFTKFVSLVFEYMGTVSVIKLRLSSSDFGAPNQIGRIAISYDDKTDKFSKAFGIPEILKLIKDNYLGLLHLCQKVTIIRQMFFFDDFSLANNKLNLLQQAAKTDLKIVYEPFDYEKADRIVSEPTLFVLSNVQNCSPYVHDPAHFYKNEFFLELASKCVNVFLLVNKDIPIPAGPNVVYLDDSVDFSRYKKIIFFNITPESFKIINKFNIKKCFFLERTILIDDRHGFDELRCLEDVKVFTYYSNVNIGGKNVYSSRPEATCSLDVNLYNNSLIKFFNEKIKVADPKIEIQNAIIHPVTFQYLTYAAAPKYLYDICILGNSNRDFKFIYEFIVRNSEYRLAIIYGNPSREMFVEHHEYLELLNKLENVTVLRSLDNELSIKLIYCSKFVLLPFRAKSFAFSGVTCMNNPLNMNKLILAAITPYTEYLKQVGIDILLYQPDNMKNFEEKVRQALGEFDKSYNNIDFARKFSFNRYFTSVLKEINKS